VLFLLDIGGVLRAQLGSKLKKFQKSSVFGLPFMFLFCFVLFWSVSVMGIATEGSKNILYASRVHYRSRLESLHVALLKWAAVALTSVNYVTSGASPPMTDK
jgi:hypothetical protein